MIYMKVSKDEKVLLFKYKRAKKYAQNNRQAGLEIVILPGGRVFLIKGIFQDKIEVEEVNKP